MAIHSGFTHWKWWFPNSYVGLPEGKSHQIPLNYHFPMVFLWISYDFPMVFLRFSYGLHHPKVNISISISVGTPFGIPRTGDPRRLDAHEEGVGENQRGSAEIEVPVTMRIKWCEPWCWYNWYIYIYVYIYIYYMIYLHLSDLKNHPNVGKYSIQGAYGW